MTENKITPNNLGEALSVRYPSVWVHSIDSVEVIEFLQASIRNYSDLSYYLFHSLSGLQKFNYKTNRFDTVLVEIQTPDGPAQVPLLKFSDALDYLYDETNATLLVLNAEQFEDSLNDIHSFLHFEWRNAWRNDNLVTAPLQIVFTSTTKLAPPEQVQPLVPLVKIGYPSESELADLVAFISEKTKVPVSVQEVAKASKGLSKFEAISLYHSQIAREQKIDIEELEAIKFAKIASRTNLEVIKPSVTLDQVAGAENIKKILETSIWMKENPEESARYGFGSSMHRFLLLGLSGTGKSYFCEAAANFLKLNLVRTGLSQVMSKYVGESENNTRAMFDQIAALDPICVWSDEFGRDTSGGQSSHVVDAGTTTRMHGLYLTGIQELSESTYFFAAANDVSTLAPEMLRADRFDKIFFVGFPTFEQRLLILRNLLNNVEHSINIERIAEATASYTGAELKSSLKAASSRARSERRPMNTDDAKYALNRMKDRIWTRHTDNVMMQYRQAVDTYEWASDAQHAEAKDYIEGRPPRPNVKKVNKLPITTSATIN